MIREDHAKLKEEILKASLKVFSKKGFRSSTMEEIAKEAGCSVGMIYKLFPGKKELYRELMVGKALEFHKAITSSIHPSRNPVEVIRRIMESKAQVVFENREFVKLYIAETTGVPFDVRLNMIEEIRTLYNEYLQLLEDLFRRGIEKGIFKELDPYKMALSLDAMVNAALMDYVENERDVDIETILHIFLKGVMKER